MSRLPILILLVWLTSYQASGQTQINALTNGTIYQGNTFSLDQWQWQVSANQYTGQSAFIQVVIFDQLGNVIYRIAGHTFQLGSQNTYAGSRLNPEETQFIAPSYQRSLDRAHCLPKGKYLIESTLYLVDHPGNQAIARHQQTWYQRQACMLTILPLTPANRVSVCETYPVFRWSSANPGAALQFEFNLYGHSPEQGDVAGAPPANHPILQTVLNTPVYQLAPGIAAMTKGHQYSWQVISREAGNIIAQSPLRSFTYGCATPKEKNEEKTSRLMYLRAGENGHTPTYTIEEPILNFSFVQRVPNDKYLLEIKDEQGNTLASQPISTRPGHNYLSLPFSDLGLPGFKKSSQLKVNLRSDRGNNASFSILIDYP